MDVLDELVNMNYSEEQNKTEINESNNESSENYNDDQQAPPTASVSIEDSVLDKMIDSFAGN